MDGAAAFLQEKLDQRLRLAAEKGDEAECKETLNAGADYDTFSSDDETKMTAFHLAARAGREAVCRLFLERGARVTYKSKAVYLAAVAGHRRVCKFLLDSMAHGDGQGGLFKKTSLNKRTLALLMAASDGDAAACQVLLEAGAAVDSADDLGRCALHAAACDGHVAVCRLLLNKGAEIMRSCRPDTSKPTALVGAACNGHVAVCDLLLERGADVGQAAGGGKTAFYMAAYAGKEEACRLILDKRAAKWEKSRSILNSSLKTAADRGHVRICELLMDRGADYRNALREAIENKRIEVVQVIVLHERFDPESVTAVECDGLFLKTVMHELRQWKMIPDSVQELLIQLGHARTPQSVATCHT